MYKSFKEMEQYLIENKITKKIAVARAEDEHCLDAIIKAKKAGIIEAILIGDITKIKEILTKLGGNINDYEYIECFDEIECSNIAMKLISDNKCDIPMKGIMQSSSFLKGILNRDNGLRIEGNVVSHAVVIENNLKEGLLLAADCAINITPRLEDKAKIIKNTVMLSEKLGIKNSKVAVLSAVEKVNDKIESTLDAEKLTEMNNNGEITNCKVFGPLALDNAISKEAAIHKGITSDVAGDADILLFPELVSGNVFYKSLTFFANLNVAGVVIGAKVPAILTSRADSLKTKYNSIILTIICSLN